MSGIPIIGKVFEALDDIPILKVVAVAAIVYFSVGAATSAFTSSGATAAAGGVTSTATGAQLSGTVFAETAAANTAAAASASTVSGVAGLTSAQTAAGVAGNIGGGITAAGTGTGMVAGQAGTQIASSTLLQEGTKQVVKEGAKSWFAKNPLVTMMLGQGLMGAAAADSEAEARKAEIAQRDKERKERGLMGFDWEGKRPGVVGTAMAPRSTDVQEQRVQAAQAPIVATQQVGQQNDVLTPQQVPVQKEDLPKLNQNGQIATG